MTISGVFKDFTISLGATVAASKLHIGTDNIYLYIDPDKESLKYNQQPPLMHYLLFTQYVCSAKVTRGDNIFQKCGTEIVPYRFLWVTAGNLD